MPDAVTVHHQTYQLSQKVPYLLFSDEIVDLKVVGVYL